MPTDYIIGDVPQPPVFHGDANLYSQEMARYLTEVLTDIKRDLDVIHTRVLSSGSMDFSSIHCVDGDISITASGGDIDFDDENRMATGYDKMGRLLAGGVEP